MNFIRENIVKIVTFIVILVVVIIIFSFVFKGTGLSKANTYSQMEENLKAAAEKYANKNVKLLPKDEKEQSKINTDTLINAKYIKELHSIEDEKVKCSGYVLINKSSDNYKYTPYLKCGNYYETTSLVDYIKKNETIVNSDDGLYEYGEKYVYRGENPNNYLKIEKNIYRIVELDKDDVLKLIFVANTDDSYDYYDDYTWDDRYNIETDDYSGINDYSKSRIKDKLTGLYKSQFFSDTERSFIKSYDICIGKKYVNDTSIDGVAECSTKYPDQKIDLLNIYEYMRASIDPNCTNSNTASCSNYNYLRGICSVTLNAVADNTYQIYGVCNSVSNVSEANDLFSINPVIYIDKNALYAGGNGTGENPYTIR